MRAFWEWLKSLFTPKPVSEPAIPAPAPAPRPPVVTPPLPGDKLARVTGLDVSHYQDAVDWKKAWDLGFRFCFAKATDGLTYKDDKYAMHREQAKRAGLIFGSYHFFRFAGSPTDQAHHFFRTTGGVGVGELPLVLDIEWDRKSERYSEGHIMDEAGAKAALACATEIERLSGITPIIYTNAYFFTGFPNAARFSRFIPWIPSYSDSLKPSGDKVKVPAPWKSWTFWQDSEDFTLGKIKAIDTNVFRGSLDDLKALTRKS